MVPDFLEGRLPAPMAGQIDAVIQGGWGNLGSMPGKKQPRHGRALAEENLCHNLEISVPQPTVPRAGRQVPS